MSMNLFDRFARVAKANLNNLAGKLEDPEKVLDQALQDLQKDLVTIRQSYAEVMATQKRMERQKDQAESLAEEWYKRAQLALEKDDEELAREALSRKQQQVDAATNLEEQIRIQSDSLAKLYEGMSQLETKITEAKAQKDNFVARARAAKTTTKVNDMLSSVSGSTSMDAFERMKEKVEMLETQAEVAGQLGPGSSPPGMEDRFKALEAGSAVDDELAAMKKSLAPGGPETKALPEPSAAVEDELAKLKKDAAKE